MFVFAEVLGFLEFLFVGTVLKLFGTRNQRQEFQKKIIWEAKQQKRINQRCERMIKSAHNFSEYQLKNLEDYIQNLPRQK